MLDEELAQEVQREIDEDGPVHVRGPQRKNKHFVVTLWKSWRGLDDHLMGHASLKACAVELEHAGHSFKLPTGSTVFVDAENYDDATDAARDLKRYQILVAHPFLRQLKKQVKIAPRVSIRGIRLLSNFFGHDGAELRTFSTAPSAKTRARLAPGPAAPPPPLPRAPLSSSRGAWPALVS